MDLVKRRTPLMMFLSAIGATDTAPTGNRQGLWAKRKATHYNGTMGNNPGGKMGQRRSKFKARSRQHG